MANVGATAGISTVNYSTMANRPRRPRRKNPVEPGAGVAGPSADGPSPPPRVNFTSLYDMQTDRGLASVVGNFRSLDQKIILEMESDKRKHCVRDGNVGSALRQLDEQNRALPEDEAVYAGDVNGRISTMKKGFVIHVTNLSKWNVMLTMLSNLRNDTQQA